jgi:hypothetical protein
VTIVVTLAIDPTAVGEGQTTTVIAARLGGLGGTVFSWAPDINGMPARASFKLHTQDARDRFVADALKIPGVSLATRVQGSSNEQESN